MENPETKSNSQELPKEGDPLNILREGRKDIKLNALRQKSRHFTSLQTALEREQREFGKDKASGDFDKLSKKEREDYRRDMMFIEKDLEQIEDKRADVDERLQAKEDAIKEKMVEAIQKKLKK